MTAISKEFARSVLGNSNNRFVELVSKKKTNPLIDSEKAELQGMLDAISGAQQNLQPGNLQDQVDLGGLRKVLNIVGNSPEIATQVGTEFLKRSGFDGKVVNLDGNLAVLDNRSNQFLGLNPEGPDISDLGAIGGSLTDALPLVGTLAGIPLGGAAGAGLGGIAGGALAEGRRTAVQEEFLPDRQTGLEQAGDIAGAALGEAGLNAAGGFAGKLASPFIKGGLEAASPFINNASKNIGNISSEILPESVQQGFGKAAQAVGDFLPKEPTALDQFVSKTPILRNALGVDAPQQTINNFLTEGLTDDQIAAQIKSTNPLSLFDPTEVNISQSKALQDKGRQALQGGPQFLQSSSNVNPDLLKSLDGKIQKTVGAGQQQTEAKKAFELFGGNNIDPVRLGEEIQDKVSKTLQAGIQAEKLGFDSAAAIASNESKLFPIAEIKDIILDTPESTMSTAVKRQALEGLQGQHATPKQLLETGRNLSGIINSDIRPSEFAILSKARGKLISDPDSVFNSIRSESPSIEAFLKTSGDRVARNDAIQGKFKNLILGSKVDLTTGKVGRETLDGASVFKNFVKAQATDPTDFERFAEFTGIDDQLKDRVNTAFIKQQFNLGNKNATKALNNINKNLGVIKLGPNSEEALVQLNNIAQGEASSKQFGKATVDDVVKGIKSGTPGKVQRAQDILDIAGADQAERNALFNSNFVSGPGSTASPGREFTEIAKSVSGPKLQGQAVPQQFTPLVSESSEDIASAIANIEKFAQGEEDIARGVTFQNTAQGQKDKLTGNLIGALINSPRLGGAKIFSEEVPTGLSSGIQAVGRGIRDIGDVTQFVDDTTQDATFAGDPVDVIQPEPQPVSLEANPFIKQGGPPRKLSLAPNSAFGKPKDAFAALMGHIS